MKKQDEINLFAMLLERERRVACATSEAERQDAAGVAVADMGIALGLQFKRIEYITDKWARTLWFDASSDTPWGYIVGADGRNKKAPGDEPCAAFPATLDDFQLRAEMTVDPFRIFARMDRLIAVNRTMRLEEEELRCKQQASVDELMASFREKGAREESGNAVDVTSQAPMETSIAMATADSEARRKVLELIANTLENDGVPSSVIELHDRVQHLITYGRVPAFNTQVCQEALRILRQKGIV